MRRLPLLTLAMLLAVASSGQPQDVESTRSLRLQGDHREILDDLLGPVHPESTDELLDRVERVVQGLRLGDRATFRVPAVAEGELAYLEMEIASDLGEFVRFRGSGAPFRVVRDAVEARWRGSLLAIDDTVRLAVSERTWPRGSPPELRLSYRTVREFSCDGYRLEAEFGRTSDTLRLELWGVAPPRGLCGQMISPAAGGVELDLGTGSYTLAVDRDGERDVYELLVTDSTMRLRTVRAAFTAADTRVILRRPPNSFALYCGTTTSRAPLCGRFRSWVASREGITVHTFPAGGVVPYRGGIGTHHAERHYFRYGSRTDLEPVRTCLDRLKRVLSGLEGTHMTVELWNGEWFTAWPDPHAASEAGSETGPNRTASAPCLPSVPPPSVDPPDAGGDLGGIFAASRAWGRTCTFRREMEARLERERAARRERSVRAVRGDSSVRIPAPVSAPSPWPRADQIAPGDGETRRPWNGSRSAVDRSRFHHELREWMCREEETFGGGEERRGTPWFWVEEAGDWFYLGSETTARGVEAYLERVDRQGDDLAWITVVSQDAGSERVAVGPDEIVIPGFAFYRWRP